MAKNKSQEKPQWLIYGTNGELDLSATLKAVPDSIDRNCAFFREVPEWFEAGPDNLDDLRDSLTAIDNMPEEERKKHTPEEIAVMRRSMERVISCNEMMAEPGLAELQREVLRCLCYWFSLKAMGSIPMSPEEEENLF